MPERDLLELVELCYAAVTGPTGWTAFLGACRAAFDSTVASVATVQFRPRRLDWAVIDGIAPIFMNEIVARGAQDPRAALFPMLRPGQGYLFDASGHDIAAFKRSPYYTDCQGKLDFLWAVITRLDEARGIDGLWALHRPERAPPFAASDLRDAEVLARHIGRARQLQVDLELAESRSTLCTDLLDRLPIGLFLLTGGQRVAEANRAARSIAEAGDGIALQRDKLVIGDSGVQRTLAAMIDAAAKGRLDDVGGVLAVPRPSGAADYTVSVVRCFSDLTKVIGPPAAVLVAVADPAREVMVAADALRALWQLTAGEAQIALALTAGDSLATIAVKQGITLGTARVHLKHILAKSGTHRQSELVRLILAGPGALPTSRSAQPLSLGHLSTRPR
jgi:DNA-binding CsgD family transcriptional regulator